MPRKYPKVEIGQVFGKWTVVGEGDRKHGYRSLVCVCECGTRMNITEYTLARGWSKQCAQCRNAATRKYTTDALGYDTSVAEAAREFGVNLHAALRRARNGQDPFSPRRRGVVVLDGKEATIKEASARAGIKESTVRKRLRRLGWTLPQALGIEPPPPRRRRK